MSTAALASARRRRTTNEMPSPSQSVSNKVQQESQNPSKQGQQGQPVQSLTPLQILQVHDNKLKELETLMIEVNNEEYIAHVVDEKIKELMQSKLSALSNDLDKVIMSSNAFEAKLQLLETTIQTNSTLQNVKIDEFKNGIQNNFNTFKENTNKMIDLLNLKEKNISMPSIKSHDSTVEKVDMLTKEVNELKLLVIKNQTLALETCGSIITMKDDFKLVNEKIAQIIDIISDLNNRQCDQSQCDQSQCNQPQCDPAQMFLQSFMRNNLFGGANKISINNEYNCDNDEDDDESNDNIRMNNKKLHIDLTDEHIVLGDEDVISGDEKINLDTNELIIDENQLQEILELNSMDEINLRNDSLKQDVLDEIKNISLVDGENNLEQNNVPGSISNETS